MAVAVYSPRPSLQPLSIVSHDRGRSGIRIFPTSAASEAIKFGHQRARDTLAMDSGMDQQLADLRPVGLVQRCVEVQLHRSHDPSACVRDQRHARPSRTAGRTTLRQKASPSSVVNDSTKPMLAPAWTQACRSAPRSRTRPAMSSAVTIEMVVCTSLVILPHTIKRMYLAAHGSGVAKLWGHIPYVRYCLTLGMLSRPSISEGGRGGHRGAAGRASARVASPAAHGRCTTQTWGGRPHPGTDGSAHAAPRRSDAWTCPA